MRASPLIEQLVDALRALPGIGPKSAQRIAFNLLERNRSGARRLADSLTQAVERIGHCRHCRTLTELELCGVCAHPRRNRGLLCVVESPTDVHAIEHVATYDGLYFVLMGRLSPLDGIGPDDIGMAQLEARLAEGEVREIILATNSTVEGEATAHYIAELARAAGVRTTRIAQGIPLGGELEYTDGSTLAHALHGRREI